MYSSVCTVQSILYAWIFFIHHDVQYAAKHTVWITVSHNAVQLTWPSVSSVMNEPESKMNNYFNISFLTFVY